MIQHGGIQYGKVDAVVRTHVHHPFGQRDPHMVPERPPLQAMGDEHADAVEEMGLSMSYSPRSIGIHPIG